LPGDPKSFLPKNTTLLGALLKPEINTFTADFRFKILPLSNYLDFEVEE
jgi:hypothetical protein